MNIPRQHATIGLRLRIKRRERGLTQEALALLIDSSQSAVQKIENGHSLRPRNLHKLADALEVSSSWLAFGEGAANLIDAEAQEVAEAWAKLPKHLQRQVKNQILALTTEKDHEHRQLPKKSRNTPAYPPYKS